MKTTVLWALIALNVVLLGSLLGLRWHENAAQAQAAARRPGDYLMIDGQISGGNVGLVYVLDSVNGQLSALTFQGSTGSTSQIESMPPMNLAAVFADEPTSPSGVKHR